MQNGKYGHKLCDLLQQTQRLVSAFGVEVSPLNIAWYNELRLDIHPSHPQLIDSPNPNAVGFLFLSNYLFFDSIVGTFRKNSHSLSNNVVECTTETILEDVCKLLSSFGIRHYEVTTYNLDKPPFLHAQTLGHVAGIVEYVDGRDMKIEDHQMRLIEQTRTEDGRIDIRTGILGLSLHPQYGGWFAYRGLVVLHNISSIAVLERPQPLRFLTVQEREEAIIEYNMRPGLGYWRDFHDKRLGIVKRYSAIAFAFFNENSVLRRRRILDLLASEDT